MKSPPIGVQIHQFWAPSTLAIQMTGWDASCGPLHAASPSRPPGRTSYRMFTTAPAVRFKGHAHADSHTGRAPGHRASTCLAVLAEPCAARGSRVPARLGGVPPGGLDAGAGAARQPHGEPPARSKE